MPRDNDKPFPCKDCRFEIGSVCFRNPPSSVWIGGQLNTFYPSIHNVASGCFAGEPRVKRSCSTCVGNEQCTIFTHIQTTHAGSVEDRSCDDWHCTDWKGEK
jgi:hypothetical protein